MSDAKEIRDLMARCARLERQVAKLPTRIGSSVGGGTGGLADEETETKKIVYCHLAETKEELPLPGSDGVEIWHEGMVTDGDNKHIHYKVDEAGTGWVSFMSCE